MIFFDKKSFDFNHDLNQWLKSARFIWANPEMQTHCSVFNFHNRKFINTMCAFFPHCINELLIAKVQRSAVCLHFWRFPVCTIHLMTVKCWDSGSKECTQFTCSSCVNFYLKRVQQMQVVTVSIAAVDLDELSELYYLYVWNCVCRMIVVDSVTLNAIYKLYDCHLAVLDWNCLRCR